MPHYKDGTPAKIGDVVKGKGYNIPHEITGVLVGLRPSAATCNVTISTVTRSGFAQVAIVGRITADGKIEPIEGHAPKIEPTFEYGEAAAFEKIG